MTTTHLLTAGEAAKAVGISTPAISKAIKSGRLPYVQKTHNGYLIDPNTLFHVFREHQTLGAQADKEARAARSEGGDVSAEIVALRVANVRLESELKSLNAVLHAERQRAEAAERDRDAWRQMSETLVTVR